MSEILISSNDNIKATELNRYFINIPKDLYPRYNIVYVSKNSVTIHIALAGFKRDNIKVILVNEHTITVTGSSNTHYQYLHKSISYRNFALYFNVQAGVFINNVTFTDGLLQISLSINPNSNVQYIPITEELISV